MSQRVLLNRRTLTDLFLGAALLSSFYSLIQDVLLRRFLMHDGASYVFALLDHRPGYDGRFTRFFHIVFQLPVYLIEKFSQDTESISFLLTTLGMTYVVFTFASLALSYWLLKRCRASEFFPFVVLSYALTSLSVFPNVAGLAYELTLLFWPAFIVCMFSPALTRRGLCGLLFTLLAFAFSHESALFLVVLFICIAFWRRKESDRFKILLYAAILSLLCILVRIYILAPGHSQYFVADLLSTPTTMRLVALCFIGIWAIYAVLQYVNLEKRVWILFLANLVLLIYGLGLLGHEHSYYWEIVKNRSSAILFCAIIAIGLYTWRFFQISRPGLDLKISAAFALILAISHNMYGAKNWQETTQALTSLMEERPVCAEYSKEEVPEIVANQTSTGSLSLLTLLLSEKRTVPRLLFIKYPGNPMGENFCCSLEKGYLLFDENNYQVENSTHYRFTALKKELSYCHLPTP